MARVLAVDPGLKRVGLALSDPLQLIASPFRVLAYTGPRKLAQAVKEIAREKEVELVVIGYPTQIDQEPSPVCLLAEKLSSLLEARQIKTLLWDEHYTSWRAAEVMRRGGVKAKKMKGKLDMVAASLLLADYLKSKQGEEKNHGLQ